MSASRVTRNAEAPEDLHPREQLVQVAPRRAPRAARTRASCPARPGTGTNRASEAGTFTRAKAGRFSFLSVSSTASESDRFETNGNGWAGSNASGVRTGNTTLSKYADELLAALGLDFLPREDAHAGLGELGSRSSLSVCIASPASRCTISRIMRSCSGADRPSALRSVTEASSCSCRPETRIMKNSSRFEWKIARNFRRSSRGQLGSSASSSTRPLNASHEISRLKYSA